MADHATSKQRLTRHAAGPALLCLICLLLTACAGSIRLDNSLLGRLTDRGPVALSADNPFLAANLLVAKECERSPEMKGFIKHRGTPAAIEVLRDTFSPVRLKFYYPERSEYYLFEEMNETWMISGPFTPGQESAPVTLTATGNGSDRALLNLGGTESDTSPAAIETAAIEEATARHSEVSTGDSLSSEETPPVKSAPGSPRRFLKHGSIPASPPSPASLTSGPGFRSPAQPRMLDEGDTASAQAPLPESLETAAGHQAEMSPRGDLVHYVTYSGETISILARWYTGDRNNASRIAHINGIQNPDMLGLGDAIVIPSYLLKNTNRLTEPGLKQVQQGIQELKALSPSATH
jgi:hypothetical protein